MKSPITTMNKGSIIDFNGRKVIVDQLISGVWQGRDASTNEYLQITAAELLLQYRLGRVKMGLGSVLYPAAATQVKEVASFVPLDLLSPRIQLKLKGRQLFLESIIKNLGTKPSGESVKRHLDSSWSKIVQGLEKKPSSQTVIRWLRNYLHAGKSILSLTGHVKLRGNTARKIDDKLIELGEKTLHEVYFSPERRTLKVTLAVFQSYVKDYNCHPDSPYLLKIPTINSLRSLLARYAPEEIYAARHGHHAARVRYRNATHSYDVEYPTDRCEIDHTPLDIVVIDADTGIVVGRPYLTMVLDKRTRAIAGFWLSMEPPSAESLAKAFKHAILPKDVQEIYPEIQNKWNVFGVPKLVACDNGMEFYAKAFIDMCLQLGIRVEYMPRKTPWWKGSIERFLKTLNESVCGLMAGGRTFGSIEAREDYDSEKTAVITLPDLEKFITMWIVDVYNQTMHRSIQTSPARKWDAEIDLEDIRYLQDPAIFDKITGHIATRSWQHYGIEMNNIHYNSPELKALWNRFIGNQKSIKTTIRWSAEDIGQITVVLPNDSFLVVPAKDAYPHAKGMSLAHHQITRQDIINHKLDPDMSSNVADAIARIFHAGQADGKKGKALQAAYKKQLAREKRDATKPLLSEKTITVGESTLSELLSQESDELPLQEFSVTY